MARLWASSDIAVNRAAVGTVATRRGDLRVRFELIDETRGLGNVTRAPLKRPTQTRNAQVESAASRPTARRPLMT